MEQFAATTHPGLKRGHNEDCYEADPDLGLWLVADGVGGHSFGEVASDIVKTTVSRSVAAGQSLLNAVSDAHSEVLKEMRQREENLGMGSTVVAFQLKDRHYEVAWVGDSRAYLWDGEELIRLTRDHTHVYDLVDRGILSIADAATHPERHVLTQSIGVFEDMELQPGSAEGELSEGQQILLCSDGLTDELTDTAIARQLRRNGNTQAQVDALLGAALAAGGRDNVTVVVIGEAAGDDDQVTMEPGMELEVTQNIGHAVFRDPVAPKRKKTDRRFWIAVSIIAVLILVTWI